MALTTVFTNTGKNKATLFLASTSPSGPFMKYIAIGSDNTTATVTDTALTVEATTGTWSGYARVSSTVTQQTVTVTNDTIQWVGSFTNPGTTNPYGLKETGNFDAATTGNIGIHSSFDVQNLQNGDTAQITLQLTLT